MNSLMQSPLEIAADHPAYAGHFPALPVLPGAVLLDRVFAAVQQDRQIDVTQWQIGVAKFLSAVRPGEALQLEHEMTDSGLIRFTIRNSQRAVASGTLSPKSPAPPA
jgi:3-hydroxymyristoyl/3-hydroxydecanoyl-(acyl carrier protein) dehydratase